MIPKHSTWIFSLAALLCSALAAAQSIGTLSFTPAHPNSNEVVSVVLTPSSSDFCADGVTVSGNSVVILSQPGACGASGGTTDQAFVGPLGAGTYPVNWEFPDDFFHNGASGTLTVAAAPSTTPLSSPLTLLALAALLLGASIAALRAGSRRNRRLRA